MSLGRLFKRYGRDRRGSAAVEYVLWLAALSPPIFGAADIGYYGYQVIQALNAAQMAVQAAFAKCASVAVLTFPATQYCGANGDDLNTAILNGEHSTSLGSNVTIAASNAREEYMCKGSSGLVDVDPVNKGKPQDGVIATKTTGAVTDVDAAGTDTTPTQPSPFNCVSTNTSTAEPGDYIVVTVSYTFKPLFKGFSVVNLMGGQNVNINQTAYTRLE
jgi:Flp pilus assembly protein TadG